MASDASFNEQYDALRRGCGVVELADWSSATITGPDRLRFLNNFCTNDVKSLTPGGSCEAFITNAKGRIIGHGLISCHYSELVFLGMPRQAPRLIEHLDRYIIREDVQLHDTTARRSFLLFAGGAPLRELCSDNEAGYAEFDPTIHITWNPTCSKFSVVEEFTPDQARVLMAILIDKGFVKVKSPAFDAGRIEAGTALFGVDFNEENLPQEVNRDREAISFTKGCYLGQETVARIDALGHVNQKLVGVRFKEVEIPIAGTELMKNGAQVGRVTSAAYSPQLGAPLALAMVRREANSPGTALDSPVGGCEVVSLPLPLVDT